LGFILGGFFPNSSGHPGFGHLRIFGVVGRHEVAFSKPAVVPERAHLKDILENEVMVLKYFRQNNWQKWQFLFKIALVFAKKIIIGNIGTDETRHFFAYINRRKCS
jgi:hypothetical protein